MKKNTALQLLFYSIIVLCINGSSVLMSIPKHLIENQKIGILQHGNLTFTVIYDDPSWFWAGPFIRNLPGQSILVMVTDHRTGDSKQILCKRVGNTIVCR